MKLTAGNLSAYVKNGLGQVTSTYCPYRDSGIKMLSFLRTTLAIFGESFVSYLRCLMYIKRNRMRKCYRIST